MVRSIPAGRLAQLIEAATRVFIAEGYRRTQMEDVASALGIAKGTVYGYVESKAALFDAALLYADGHDTLPDASALPLRVAPEGSAAVVRKRLEREVGGLELLAALGRNAPEDVGAELAEIIRDLYRRMERNRHAIKLVDRCALDHPELAAVWFGQGRWAQHAALVAYLDKRMSSGQLRPVPSTSVAARFLLETIAFWAVHRHWDPSPQAVSDEEVERTLVQVLLQGLTKEKP
jgi:AcrR family transcriptional regulator